MKTVSFMKSPVEELLDKEHADLKGYDHNVCNEEPETIDHSSFACKFTIWLLRETSSIDPDAIDVSAFDLMAGEMNKLSNGSKCWGLHWTMVEIVLTTAPWKERNQYYSYY